MTQDFWSASPVAKYPTIFPLHGFIYCVDNTFISFKLSSWDLSWIPCLWRRESCFLLCRHNLLTDSTRAECQRSEIILCFDHARLIESGRGIIGSSELGTLLVYVDGPILFYENVNNLKNISELLLQIRDEISYIPSIRTALYKEEHLEHLHDHPS
jgi:hypothetical protein